MRRRSEPGPRGEGTPSEGPREVGASEARRIFCVASEPGRAERGRSFWIDGGDRGAKRRMPPKVDLPDRMVGPASVGYVRSCDQTAQSHSRKGTNQGEQRPAQGESSRALWERLARAGRPRLERGSPDGSRSCGNRPAHISLIRRRNCLEVARCPDFRRGRDGGIWTGATLSVLGTATQCSASALARPASARGHLEVWP
jgi:hypothetical protein